MSQEMCFSSWCSWANRNRVTGVGAKDTGGIYLWARFDGEPASGPARCDDENVIYIGISDRTFKNRWYPLDRALRNLMKVKPGSRSARYIALFGTDTLHLYVAVLPSYQLGQAFMGLGQCSLLDLKPTQWVSNNFLDEVYDLVLQYVERRLLLMYACSHGRRPSLNEK